MWVELKWIIWIGIAFFIVGGIIIYFCAVQERDVFNKFTEGRKATVKDAIFADLRILANNNQP